LLLAQDLNGRFEIYAVMWNFADAARHAEKFGRALRLYWAAKNIAETVGAWWKEDEVEFEASLAACRAALGEEAFAKAEEEGRLMMMEQAIAYALEDQSA
jgi:hypothetical protein